MDESDQVRDLQSERRTTHRGLRTREPRRIHLKAPQCT